MPKTLLALAAGASLLVLALPGPASAADGRANGARTAVEHTDISSYHRRWHRPYRYVRRGYYRPYYGHPYAYGYGYPYYYRRPFVGVGFGPFGFGIW